MGPSQLRGHFNRICGMTSAIRHFLITSLLTVSIGLVTIVPTGRFLLVLFAGSLKTNGNIPSFPVNHLFLDRSHRGRATAAMNMTLVMKRLLLHVRCGGVSSDAKYNR